MAQAAKKATTKTTKKPVVKKTQKSADEKYCSTCAAIVHKDAEICPKCGVRQQSAQQDTQKNLNGRGLKSKTTAGILAILVGGLGVHKFYLGRVGIGLVYLFFAWTFVPALIAFIEGLIYLTFSGTDAEFTAKYTQ